MLLICLSCHSWVCNIFFKLGFLKTKISFNTTHNFSKNIKRKRWDKNYIESENILVNKLIICSKIARLCFLAKNPTTLKRGCEGSHEAPSGKNQIEFSLGQTERYRVDKSRVYLIPYLQKTKFNRKVNRKSESKTFNVWTFNLCRIHRPKSERWLITSEIVGDQVYIRRLHTKMVYELYATDRRFHIQNT